MIQATELAARRLIRQARTIAPSFVLLNFVFNDLLEKWTECEDTRDLIRQEAKKLLEAERAEPA